MERLSYNNFKIMFVRSLGPIKRKHVNQYYVTFISKKNYVLIVQ
jgi:hypothetical protein